MIAAQFHCQRCGRGMQAASPTGMGSTCARLARSMAQADRDLFGYDLDMAQKVALARVGLHIFSMTAEAHLAVRDNFRAAREMFHVEHAS